MTLNFLLLVLIRDVWVKWGALNLIDYTDSWVYPCLSYPAVGTYILALFSENMQTPSLVTHNIL